MNTPTLAALAVIATGGCLWLWLCYIRPKLTQARTYIANATTCGFLPPPPTPGALRFLKGLSRVLLWIQVGKVKYIGLENLNVDGPIIIAPNHPHYIDPAIIIRAINQPARYMAARGVMRFACGLVSLIAGR